MLPLAYGDFLKAVEKPQLPVCSAQNGADKEKTEIAIAQCFGNLPSKTSDVSAILNRCASGPGTLPDDVLTPSLSSVCSLLSQNPNLLFDAVLSRPLLFGDLLPTPTTPTVTPTLTPTFTPTPTCSGTNAAAELGSPGTNDMVSHFGTLLVRSPDADGPSTAKTATPSFPHPMLGEPECPLPSLSPRKSPQTRQSHVRGRPLKYHTLDEKRASHVRNNKVYRERLKKQTMQRQQELDQLVLESERLARVERELQTQLDRVTGRMCDHDLELYQRIQLHGVDSVARSDFCHCRFRSNPYCKRYAGFLDQMNSFP